MNKKHLFLIPAIMAGTQFSAVAQHRAELVHASNQVDKDGSYYQLNKVDKDMQVISDYLNLIFDVARKNGEDIPAGLDAKRMVRHLGLDGLKSIAQSSSYKQDVWLNKLYVENSSNRDGLFSLFGGAAKKHIVPQFAPAGTDLAFQLQLDLRKVEQMITAISVDVGEGQKVRRDMSKKIPDLGMSMSDVLAKLDVTASIAIEFDRNQRIDADGLKLPKPNLVARLDGVAWLWDIVGDKIIADSKLPFKKSTNNGVISYKVDDNLRAHLQGYSPVIVVDTNRNHIWVSLDKVYLEKCQGAGAKLADAASFKAAWQGLPKTSNSMYYISKEFLNELMAQYKVISVSNKVDADFKKAKPLIDKIMADLTKSEHGFAAVIQQREKGTYFVQKDPLPSWVGKATMALIPYIAHEQKRKKMRRQLSR